jgi:prepilin-type N-terminal cleavage/methylation domain-containing protein
MNVNAQSHPAIPSRGVTLVEILLVIGLLAILLSFAVPSVGNATARAELKAAAENVQYSVDAARTLARMTETSVAVNFELASRPQSAAAAEFGSDGELRRITFSAPAIQDYLLPEGIRLVSDHDRYTFDSRGVVLEPGRVMLLSATDDSISSAIVIE